MIMDEVKVELEREYVLHADDFGPFNKRAMAEHPDWMALVTRIEDTEDGKYVHFTFRIERH